MTTRFDELDTLAKECIEYIRKECDEIDQAMAGLAPGSHQSRGVEQLRFFAAMREQYPPEVWINPDGVPVVVSRWEAALQYVRGGKAEARKYQRALGREMEKAGV